MRNFYRDFEALNEAYNNSIHQNQPHQIVHESVSSDIDNMYRESSRKALREALKKLADVHTKDQSSLTYEDCMNEMKMYAEEQSQPITPNATPIDPLHNTPVSGGLANEESKPDYNDVDSDGDEDESMKKAFKDKEEKSDEDGESETVEEREVPFDEQLAFIKQLEEEQNDHSDEDDEETQEEASSGAAALGGTAGGNDVALQKGLDAAFDIQAKVSSERNPIKRAMMGKDAKKVSTGVNNYMQALTGKLADMTTALKDK